VTNRITVPRRFFAFGRTQSCTNWTALFGIHVRTNSVWSSNLMISSLLNDKLKYVGLSAANDDSFTR
jgi:hypothetical protein